MKRKENAAAEPAEVRTGEPADEPKATEKPSMAAKKKEAEGKVWCGPSIKNVARQYTVYEKEVPEALQAFIKENPAAKNLLVSIERFAETRIKIGTPGTAEAILYNKIKKEG